jgi:hypothetical protein
MIDLIEKSRAGAPRLSWTRVRQGAVSAVAAIFVLAVSPGAVAQEAIDPDARAVLQQMSDFLGSKASFSVSYETETEIVSTAGQKLAFIASGSIEFERSGKLFASRQGLVANAELYFDGSNLSIYGKNQNAYYTQELKGTVEDAINVVRSDIGLDAPGADLLRANVLDYLIGNVTSGTHIGETMLAGVRAHHLAFRTDNVDWQVWIRADGDPVPLQYIITSKWVAQGPNYVLRLSNWNFELAIDTARFTFVPPEGAKKVEQIDTDAIGAISSGTEEGK